MDPLPHIVLQAFLPSSSGIFSTLKRTQMASLNLVSSFTIFYIRRLHADILVFGPQSGLFFLKHAESMGKDLTAQELHEVLLLSLQWLSGMIPQSYP